MSVARFIKNQEIVETVKDQWVRVFGLLSHPGKRRHGIYNEFDQRYGSENWIPAHYCDGKVISRYDGYLMYEEGYYQFLKSNPGIREWIINTASDVYDIDPSNVNSGLEYTAQEYEVTHLQDISIRRVLTRLKLEEEGIPYDPENLPKIPIFRGDHLVHIRDKHSEGYFLNPGLIPFHRPEIGLDTYIKSWWKKDSIEDIYQRNKVMLVSPPSLFLKIAAVTRGAIFFCENKNDYYECLHATRKELWYRKGREIRKQVRIIGLSPTARSGIHRDLTLVRSF